MRKLALALALLAPSLGLAQAKEEAPQPEGGKRLLADTSRNYLRLAMNFYQQDDGGGNKDVDENMQVLQPQLLLGLGLTEKLSVSLMAQGGVVSAASASGGTRPDAESGASGGSGTRSLLRGDRFFTIEPGVYYAWSDAVGTGVNASYHHEDTYDSAGVSARFVYTTPDKNDTFLVRGSATFDSLDVTYFDGSDGGSERRTTWGLGLGWTHVLGRRTQMTLNYDFTVQDGFLSTPYNSVLVAGTEVAEVLPDSRLRHALFGRVRHLLFDRLALEPGLGLYADDWFATAASLELRAFWEFAPGLFVLQPFYRFHWQSEVDAFTDRGDTAIPDERTQDPDLDRLTSHTLGLKIVAPGVRILGVDTELELGGEYTFRSDRLNSFSATFGLLVRF